MPSLSLFRRLRISALGLVVGLFWAVFAAYVVHGSLAVNAVQLPDEAGIGARLWSPEGWKFFTRNPREDWNIVFKQKAPGVWESPLRGPNASLSNVFGLSRVPRAQGIELGLLLYHLPKQFWHPCPGDVAKCLTPLPSYAVKNRSPDPTLCGTIGVVLQRQVPWAWAGLKDPRTMPSRVGRLEVTCSPG